MLEVQIDGLEAENARLREESGELQRENARLRWENGGLRGENARLREESSELRRESAAVSRAELVKTVYEVGFWLVVLICGLTALMVGLALLGVFG